MREAIRHGDCYLKPITKLPDNLNKIDGTTIAYGEITGHSHRFENGLVQLFKDTNNQTYINVKQKSELVHEEHNAIEVLPGTYVLTMEREMNPFEQKVQQVLD